MKHPFATQSASGVGFRKFGERTGKGKAFIFDQDAPIAGMITFGENKVDLVREDGTEVTFMREAVAYVEWD